MTDRAQIEAEDRALPRRRRGARASMSALLEIRDLKTLFAVEGGGEFPAVDGISLSLDAGARWASSANPVAARASPRCRSWAWCRNRRDASRAARSCSRAPICCACRSGDARVPRRSHRDDLPGADDVAQPGVHRRRPARRRHPAAPADEPRRGQGAGDAKCWRGCAFPRPSSASTTIRTSSRAACASA